MPTKRITPANLKYRNITVKENDQHLLKRLPKKFGIVDRMGNTICSATVHSAGNGKLRLGCPDLFGIPLPTSVSPLGHILTVGDIVDWDVTASNLVVLVRVSPATPSLPATTTSTHSIPQPPKNGGIPNRSPAGELPLTPVPSMTEEKNAETKEIMAKQSKIGDIVHWPLKDLAPVEYIESVTILTSRYDSFGPGFASRKTIQRCDGSFCWGGKTLRSQSPSEILLAPPAMQLAPVPSNLHSTAEDIFCDLAVKYLELAQQCKDIPDRFLRPATSMTVTIKAPGKKWVIRTTGNPADGHPYPAVIQRLLDLFNVASALKLF